MIFYEKEYAENLLKNGFTSFISYNDLSILAKYFKYIGKNKEQIRKDLIDFCKKYNPDFNEILSWNKIKNAVNSIDKKFLRTPDSIDVTKSELEKIKNAGNYKRQRIAFVLLVIAKYSKYNDNWIKPRKKTEYSNNFYAKSDFASIFKSANITATHNEINNIMLDLFDKEMIVGTLKQSIQILFADEDSPIAIKVTNIDKMIDFCPLFCEKCGKIVKQKARRHSFCNDCYAKVRREKKAESQRKARKQ